jgi:hypothetical protein
MKDIEQSSKSIQDRVYIKQNTSSSSNQAIKGFGETISQLPLCINVFHHYVSFLNVVSQEVLSYFYVFRSPMENWILG